MEWRRALSLSVAAIALAVSLALPAASTADFHFIKIREVHPGGSADSSYVVLQMYASGQTNLAPYHHIDVYDASGSSITTFTFSSDVSNGADQATVLVADTSYSTAFPEGPTPDAEHAALDIPAAGGAVCFDAPDCVSWGNFSGDESLPSTAGNPAAAVEAGKALHRTIARGCETWLEEAGDNDDTDDSAADFSEEEPNPRSNSSPIVEEECEAPTAVIDEAPADPTNETTATFTYSSEPPGAEFECSLDGSAFFDPCNGGEIQYTGLAEGFHEFRVRAKDGGETGASAVHRWEIDTEPPTVTIDDPRPADGSPGDSVSFEFHADEGEVTYECRLTPEPSPDFKSCAPGETYAELEDGSHTFEARAEDQAGNQGEAAEHSWTVDSSASGTESSETATETTDSESPTSEPSAVSPPPGRLLAAGLAPVRRGIAALRTLCRGEEGARCSGGLGVVVRFRVRRGGRPAVRRFLIAKAGYDLLAADRLQVVRLRLTRLGRRLVLRSGRRGLKAVLFGKGAKNRGLTLSPAPRGRWARHSDPTARASAFHLMKIREVHTGGSSGGSYVVLQMHASGQNFVAGHEIDVYDEKGAKAHTFAFPGDVPNGSNQATILVAGEGYGGGPAPDATDAGLDLPAAGGAVCFESIDCVSWGGFEGSLPSPAGAPASPGGVTGGRALHRTIEPGCETLLEAADDSNDSGADFFEREPEPRSNSSPIVEGPCTSTGTDGGAGTTEGPTADTDGDRDGNGDGVRRGTLLAAGLAPVRRGRALLRVLCRGQAGARCGGVLGALARVRVRRGGRPAVRRVPIAKARYGLPADGKLRALRVRLTRLGRRLVLRSGRRGLKTIVFGKGVKNRVVTLRAAPRAAR